MAAKRKSVSKKVRFEVFKRDGFRCAYCGATPTASPLHADHVVAVAQGGDNSPANLITACVDCNLGKGARPLEEKDLKATVTQEADRDHAQQIREYLAIQRDVEAARSEVAAVVACRWEEEIGPLSQAMYKRLPAVIKRWPIEKLEEAIQITAAKLGSIGNEYDGYVAIQQAKYFHGVLRKWRESAEGN